MSKIVRHEFPGNAVVFYLLCLSGIGIPAAVLYLLSGTVTVEEEIDDSTEFLKRYKAGKYRT